MTTQPYSLSSQHAAQLAASAIDPTGPIASERGYCTVTTQAELAQVDGHLASKQRLTPALVVPIYRLGQRYTTVIRPDSPRQQQRKGKTREIKYEWPTGMSLCLDVLPRFVGDLKNVLIPIWFTEGAKKADALASLNRGILPISLNGVWAWCKKDGQGRRQLLPDFDDLELRGRPVVLAFDSDYADKQEVRFALHDFARLLTKRGAAVQILTLPHAASGAKQGVDDAIAGGWSFAQLQDALTAYDASEPDLLDAAQYWQYYYDDLWAYDRAGERWRCWAGTHWESEGGRSIRLDGQAAQVMRELGLRITSSSRVDGVIRMAATQCGRDFATAPGLINFQNGTLDTTTGKLRSHQRDDDLTYCLPYAYAPADDWPVIRAFLEATIPDPIDRQTYAAHLGLALLRDTKLHKAVLLYGAPRSGKSTLLQLANLLTGNEAAANAGPELFDRETEGLRSRAVWNGRRLVTLEELPAEALRSEELVKAMTAHGGVAQRRLHQPEELSNQWTPKLLMATNDPPRYSDRSGALTERLLYIRCPNHRPEDQRDIRLLDKLRAELGGFAAHCIAVAHAVLAIGRYPESDAARALRAEIETSGDPLKLFVYEECMLDPSEHTPTEDLYRAYRAFCEKNGHTRPMAKIHFARALLERYRDLKAERCYVLLERKRCIIGLRFRTDADPEIDDGTVGTVRDSNPASSVPSRTPHTNAVSEGNGTDGTVTSEELNLNGREEVNNRENRENTVLTVPLASAESPSDALGRPESPWDSNGTASVPQASLFSRIGAISAGERKRLADEYERLTGAIYPGTPTLEDLRREVDRLQKLAPAAA